MTPFHDENYISYEEFLDIIQRETGLQSFRARASRRSYGNLPTSYDTHYKEPTPLSYSIVGPQTKRFRDDLENMNTILSSIPTHLFWRVERMDYGYISHGRPTFFRGTAGMKLGWNIFIKTTEHQGDEIRSGTSPIEKISEIKIIYLFREGNEGALNPDDEQDWYNISENEYLGWEYELSEIVWAEGSVPFGVEGRDSGQIFSFKYKSGLTLIVDNKRVLADYYTHSDSSDILKRIFGESLFDRFLNWRDKIPMDVKE
mgnify:CR=1 FL=1